PVIQPKSRGPWMHVTLELGAGHAVSEIDVSSLRILDVSPLGKLVKIGDVDLDGIPDLTVTFPREPFLHLGPRKHVLTLTGHLMSGAPIEGHATIRILETHGRVALHVVSPIGASPSCSRSADRSDAGARCGSLMCGDGSSALGKTAMPSEAA